MMGEAEMDIADIDGPFAVGEPRDIEVTFVPCDPSLVVTEINRPELTARRLAFETVVTLSRGGASGLQPLVDAGLIPIVVEHMSPPDVQIIGTVCAALRCLSSLFPSEFALVQDKIPIEFLLENADVAVIDFLQQSAFNFDSFARLLLGTRGLYEVLPLWIQDASLMEATLELLATFAGIPGAATMINFRMVLPLTDAAVGIDVRSLALSIVVMVDPEHGAAAAQRIVEAFLNEPLSKGTIVEVMHDLVLASPASVELYAEHIAARCTACAVVPMCSALLADLVQVGLLDAATAGSAAISVILAQPLVIERADAVFRIAGAGGVLGVEAAACLLDGLLASDDGETRACVAATLCACPALLGAEIVVEKLEALLRGGAGKEAMEIIGAMAPEAAARFLPLLATLAPDFDLEVQEMVATFSAQYQH